MEANQSGAPVSQEPPKSMNPMLVIVGVVLLAVVAFFAVRGLSGEPAAQEATNNDVNEETESMGMEEGSMVMEGESGMNGSQMATGSMETSMMVEDQTTVIRVEGGNFYFNPNEIRVKQGERVRIEFTGTGMPHDFVIDELGVRTPVVQSGGSASVEFTADQVGTFEYYCSVGQHRANGMVGKLIIE